MDEQLLNLTHYFDLITILDTILGVLVIQRVVQDLVVIVQ
jgi:hypothetical protein